MSILPRQAANPKPSHPNLILLAITKSLMGLDDYRSCLSGQNGHLKPRLAVQSSQTGPHSYYNFPHKAIYVVWQHNGYKQNEYIDP